jgi:hypothetical protein
MIQHKQTVHNDTQRNDIQHNKNLHHDTHYNDTQHNDMTELRTKKMPSTYTSAYFAPP